MWKEISPLELDGNAFKLIGKDWMLITAGNLDSFNTMTASWGGMGEFWNRRVVFTFVRPQRHTFKFIEREEYFTLCFFGEEYRKALSYCGSHSGRDVNKAKETGLTPAISQQGSVYFEEAWLVLECRKAYYQDIDPEKMLYIPPDEIYALKDYHRMYIGEIVRCMVKG